MKYTKEQVITSLELHNWSSGARCKNCSYKNHVNCTTDLLTDAILLLKDTTVEEAKWISAESSRYGSMYAGAKCSNCGGGVDGYVSIHFKFCPFCGKRMEEPKHNPVASGYVVEPEGERIGGVLVEPKDTWIISGYRVEED